MQRALASILLVAWMPLTVAAQDVVDDDGGEAQLEGDAQLEGEAALEGEAQLEGEAAPEGEAEGGVDLRVTAEPEVAEQGRAAPEEEDTSVRDALRQREAVRPWHIAFGTATGLASYGTSILGFLTYSDRYGWDGEPGSTGCASGSPILGTDGCTDVALPHLVAAATTSTLFAVTFTLALFMPDPLNAAGGSGEHATLLTVHKALRWVLLFLYLGQTALGIVSANVDLGGFADERALASAHLAVGTVTMLTMTTQGVLGSLMEW